MRTAEQIREDMFTDEARVPAYRLPPLLSLPCGNAVESPEQWQQQARPYFLDQFCNVMYGPIPPAPDTVSYELLASRDDALGGKALRREVRIRCAMQDGRCHAFTLLLYIPKGARAPVPAFLGLNFRGNQACTHETDVVMTGAQLVIPERSPWFVSGAADASTRGEQCERWNFETVIERGYASATIHYSEIFPDRPDGFDDSVLALFHTSGQLASPERKSGAIAAWAWGLIRGLEYLLTEPLIDAGKIAVHGHSRLGKTALYAGAVDPRFSMVISNNSGCCGAALSMRGFGENLEWLLYWRTYWLNPALRAYINREQALPFDQHALIALCAPRPVYVASASEDTPADPKGEFLAAVHADCVYRLFGKNGIDARELPALNTPVGEYIGYHLREGKHDITPFDWRCYLDFADRHWR